MAVYDAPKGANRQAVFDAEIIKVQTTGAHTTRLTLDIPEYDNDQVLTLITLYQSGAQIRVTVEEQ